jgi:mono/diheme cytochrome c family protein
MKIQITFDEGRAAPVGTSSRSEEKILSKKKSLLSTCALGVCAIMASLAIASPAASANGDRPWEAPPAVRKLRKPIPVTQKSLNAGAQLFHENCTSCHGETGVGDGPTGKFLPKKPANLTDSKLMSEETDGSLFWKISEGRAPMPSLKDDLTKTERWQLVNYVRTLAKNAAVKTRPLRISGSHCQRSIDELVFFCNRIIKSRIQGEITCLITGTLRYWSPRNGPRST